jgi:hypothetical protein
MDVVNSEKIEETFGINGYYGDGQMMNWFAPPTTIQNVRGIDYESTPHGVPTDEFWWIKQNRYNRESIANNIKNTTVIYPSGLPSGDRLEDYFNADAANPLRRNIIPINKLGLGAVDIRQNNKSKAALEKVEKEESKEEASKVEVSKLSVDDKILGMPKMVAIGVGVVILAIGGFVVYKKFIKK